MCVCIYISYCYRLRECSSCRLFSFFGEGLGGGGGLGEISCSLQCRRKSFLQINWNFPNLCAYFYLFLYIKLIMFSFGLQSWNCHIGDMGRRASVKRSQCSPCMLFLVFIFTSINLVTSEFSTCANFV